MNLKNLNRWHTVYILLLIIAFYTQLLFFFCLVLKSTLRSNFIMTSSLNMTGNNLALFSIPIPYYSLTDVTAYSIM